MQWIISTFELNRIESPNGAVQLINSDVDSKVIAKLIRTDARIYTSLSGKEIVDSASMGFSFVFYRIYAFRNVRPDEIDRKLELNFIQ